MERSLVRKVVVDAVEPIENADAIEAVRIGGWRVVCRKGDFSEGDVVLFFEVDSALNPHDDRYAFLKERCYKQFNLHGKLFDECLRIRTIRLRGVYSQGLVLNPDDFCEVRNKKVGEDCTALFTRLMARGVTQHYCITDGNLLPAVQDLAMMLGCDYEEV